jgi:adenine-specific DNA glycosylase
VCAERTDEEAIRQKAKGEKILELTHVLSHQKLHARFIIKNVPELPEIPDTVVVKLSDLDNYAFSRLTLKAIEFLAQR